MQTISGRNFSIISANCWGGAVYEDLKLPYQSPTIGLFFYAPCYITFLKDLRYFLSCDLEFIETSKYEDANQYRNENYAYPIGKLDNEVEIHFLHYKTVEEARDKWTRRKKRVDFDHLYIAMTDRDHCTYQLMEEFDRLPYSRKVIFTGKKYPALKSSVFLKAFKKEGRVGDLYNQRYWVTPNFNLDRWLNQN